MTNVTELAEELQMLTEFQETPRTFDEEDYLLMARYGVKRLYVDTGRAAQYLVSKYSTSRGNTMWADDLGADETEYVLLCAQIRFFSIVRANVNSMVSYTTDALSVTQGDKPFANITNTINALENERRTLFYKMVNYNTLEE